MARATKSSSIGRGTALPDPVTGGFDAFIVEATLDATGEPDGLYHMRQGNWVRETGTGSLTTSQQVGTGTSLPADPSTSPFLVFIVENTLDPIGEPNGLYFSAFGSWINAS